MMLQRADFGSFAISERVYESGGSKGTGSSDHPALAMLMGFENPRRFGPVKYFIENISYLPACKSSPPAMPPPGRYLIAELRHGLLEQLRVEAQVHPQPGTIASSIGLSLANRIREEVWVKPPDAASRLVLECLLISLLIEFCRQLQLRRKTNFASAVCVSEILCAEIRNPPTVEQLAEMMGMHSAQLCREFRAAFGCTMREYVQSCRLDQARKLLIESREPMIQIAELCGFFDQSHFTRTFKSATSLTPLAYRKKHIDASGRNTG